MRRGWILLVPMVSLFLVLVPGTAIAVPPEVVVDEPGVGESEPSRSDGYLAYSLIKRRNAHAFVLPDGGNLMRVNPRGTSSQSSSIDGTTLAYDQIRGSDSDIRFYDVATQTRSPLPQVNTPNWESDPSLSGDWLMIFRTNANRVRPARAWARLILVNLSTDERRRLVEASFRRSYLETDQVNGDWATYETCTFRRGEFTDCEVFLYRISTEETEMMPNPGQQQGTGGVSDDGTVYFTRSGRVNAWGCGVHPKILRKPVGGSAVVISRLRDGIDVLNGTFAFEESDSSTTLYFTRFNCERETSGVYRIPNADTA